MGYNIIIADDHTMFLDGLHAMLSEIPEIKQVHLATEGQQVVRLLKQFKEIDLVISDVSMPKMDGIELLATIKKQYPDTRVLILSMMDDIRTIEKVMSKKADGYLLKFADKKELKRAVMEVLEGKEYFSPAVKERYLQRLFDRKSRQHVELSGREKEVLTLLSEELTSKEISEKLFISVNTVETHRKNILLKTGCKTTIGAVKFAMENGYLDA